MENIVCRCCSPVWPHLPRTAGCRPTAMDQRYYRVDTAHAPHSGLRIVQVEEHRDWEIAVEHYTTGMTVRRDQYHVRIKDLRTRAKSTCEGSPVEPVPFRPLSAGSTSSSRSAIHARAARKGPERGFIQSTGRRFRTAPDRRRWVGLHRGSSADGASARYAVPGAASGRTRVPSRRTYRPRWPSSRSD